MIFDDGGTENDDPWRKSFKDRLLLGIPEVVWEKAAEYCAKNGPIKLDLTPTPRQRQINKLFRQILEAAEAARTALAIEILTDKTSP